MLEFKNIQFGYSGESLINGLDLQCQLGSIHGIFGSNGAGKTTLFKLTSQMLKPVGGSILWKGRPIEKDDISFLETGNYFYPYMKGREYLELLNTKNKDILRWNELFELPLEELVENYSTGMKKKLAFIGILLQDRDLLILDEPFNGVDIESNEKLFTIIKQLKLNGKTILISSHIFHSLVNLCDRISQLQEGQIHQTYHPNEFNSLSEKLKEKADHDIKDTLNELLGGA